MSSSSGHCNAVADLVVAVGHGLVVTAARFGELARQVIRVSFRFSIRCFGDDPPGWVVAEGGGRAFVATGFGETRGEVIRVPVLARPSPAASDIGQCLVDQTAFHIKGIDNRTGLGMR